MTSLCLICGRAEPSIGYLDPHCFDRLDDTLRAIQAESECLSAVPSMAASHGTRGGTLASHRSPARLDVLVLTDPRTAADEDGTLGVLAVLGSWARVVREDRALAWPERVTVLSERKLLTAHLSWVVTQLWVDEFAAEVKGLLRQLQRANGTAPEPPAGRCFRPTDAGECGGPIWIDEAIGHAHCGRCRATWDGPAIALLGEQFELDEIERNRVYTDDGRPMLTASEIAKRLGVTVNAAYIRLSRARIRAVRGYFDADRLLTVKATA